MEISLKKYAIDYFCCLPIFRIDVQQKKQNREILQLRIHMNTFSFRLRMITFNIFLAEFHIPETTFGCSSH